MMEVEIEEEKKREHEGKHAELRLEDYDNVEEVLDYLAYSSTDTEDEDGESKITATSTQDVDESEDDQFPASELKTADCMKQFSQLSLTKRRTLIKERCFAQCERRIGKEKYARSKGYASFVAFERSRQVECQREARKRELQTWNRERHYGARGHEAYKDGRNVYQELTGRRPIQIDEFFEETLIASRRPLTPNETTLIENISKQERNRQAYKKNEVLHQVNCHIKMKEDSLSNMRYMIIEDFRSTADKQISENDQDVIPHICRELLSSCKLELGDLQQEYGLPLQALYEKRNKLTEEFDRELDFRIKRELQRQQGRNIYSQSCDALRISQCFQILNQIGQKQIMVANYGLTEQQIEALVQALILTEVTETVNLAENLLHDNGCFAFSNLLKQPKYSLTSLDLSRNGISIDGADSLFNALQEGSPGLRILNLSHNDIGRGSSRKLKRMCYHLSRCLTAENGIQELDIGYNECGSVFGECLGSALRKPDCSLVRLNLRYNNLTNVGCKMLLLGVQSNKSLKFLDLSTNGCSDDTAKMLAQTIESHDCILEDVNISYCRIGPEGAKELGKSIESNKSLMRLNLRGCNIDASGTLSLIQALASNVRLESLSVDFIDTYECHLALCNRTVIENEIKVEVIGYESIVSLIAQHEAKGEAYGTSNLPSFPPGISEPVGIAGIMHKSEQISPKRCVPGLCCLAQITKSKASPWFNVQVMKLIDDAPFLEGKTSPKQCEVLRVDYGDTQIVELENLRILPKDIAVVSLSMLTSPGTSTIGFLPLSLTWHLTKESSFFMTFYIYKGRHPDKGNIIRLIPEGNKPSLAPERREDDDDAPNSRNSQKSAWMFSNPGLFPEQAQVIFRLPIEFIDPKVLRSTELTFQAYAESQSLTCNLRKTAQEYFGIDSENLAEKLRL